MKLFDIKVLAVLLSGVSPCISSQAFATDDVNKAVESLAKLYKVDKLLNETLFGSFAATDSAANVSPKYTYKSKKSGPRQKAHQICHTRFNKVISDMAVFTIVCTSLIFKDFTGFTI